MYDNGIEYEDDYDGYVDEDEEEIQLAERELAEDAQWKVIQKNTFTRWANQHLKPSNLIIDDLQYDLADGLKLINLVQELSGSNFRHTHKRPNFRTQKLENVTMVLRFLEESEGLRLVNIDSSDITDCRLKLILGLIWTLILHYSITMPLWEGEDANQQDGQGKGPSPKQRLLGWINSKMPHKPVKNFTTDWNDGTAIGALVDACAPGLCPNWSQWDPKQALKNAKEAINTAEEHLNVAPLIQPHEMINPKVDEKAMMTYLSQFPNAQLNNNAPLLPKTNSMRVRAYGPGLELEGNTIGNPAPFTVDTFNAGKGNLDIIVLNPKGQKEPCEIFDSPNKELAYSCSYIPSMEGEYRIIIKFANSEIPNSPFKVNVKNAAGDPSKVTASGPGIEPVGNEVGRRTFFNVFTAEAGPGSVDCVILDTKGRKDSVKPKITKQSENKFLIEYTTKEEGLHSVNVFFAGVQIQSSPFGVMVSSKTSNSDAKQAYATGRGIQPEGVRVRDVAEFQVHTEDAGFADLGVNVYGPGRSLEKCQIKKVSSCLYECSYIPQRPGPYVVDIKYGNNPIHLSPFNVDVAPYKESKIKAFGPGLTGGIVSKPAFFEVETNGETGALGFSIKGPSEAKIDCVDNGDGSANVTYWPTVPGEYAVHILCDDENIPKSPYMAQIQLDTKLFDPLKVTAYGPGLISGISTNKPADFIVNTKNAGSPSTVKAECFDVTGQTIPVQIRDNNDGTYSCRYTPKIPGKHTVIVSYGNVNIPESPFKVNVIEAGNAANIKVYGPGIERAKTNIETYFVVDCKLAGSGDIGISVLDEKMRDVPVVTDDNGDGTFTIKYTPKTTGPTYTIQIFFSEAEIPQSPFKVPIESDNDFKKYKINNLNNTTPIGQLNEFEILTPFDGSKVRPEIIVKSPNGSRVPVKLQETNNGFVAGFTPTVIGPHTVTVECKGNPIGNSPYKVIATDRVNTKEYPETETPLLISADYAIDNKAYNKPSIPVQSAKLTPVERSNVKTFSNPNKQRSNFEPNEEIIYPVQRTNEKAELRKPNVTAYGEGLVKGVANIPASFIIDSTEEPPAPLGVTIEGPMEAKIDYIDNGDGTCSVNYLPKEPGSYIVNVLYNDEHIKDSPFNVTIYPDTKSSSNIDDVAKVTAYGPGLNPTGVFKDSFSKFTVNAKPIDFNGKGIVKAIITNPFNQRSTCTVDNNHDGTYSCSYSPAVDGQHKIDITYDGVPVAKSPYFVPVYQGSDPSRIRAYGPGLEEGITKQPQKFTVDLEGAGQGGLGLSIEGPADAQIQCFDNKDGTCSVQYLPQKPGSYDVSIKFNEKHIPGSPFTVPIHDIVDVSKVKCYGPGLERNGSRVFTPSQFTVDASKAGEAPLKVNVIDTATKSVKPAQILPKSTPGLFDVTYIPENIGNCEIEVLYNNMQVPGSPFVQNVLNSCEPEKVIVTGEGVRPHRGHLIANKVPSLFTINTRDAGESDLELMVTGPNNESVNLDVDNHGDGTFTCQYKHDVPGNYTVKVLYGNKNVPGSPFIVPVHSEAKPEQCYIEGPILNEVPVGKTVTIPVNTQNAGDGILSAKNVGPVGNIVPCSIENERYGHSTVSYVPQKIGAYEVQLMFNDENIPNGSIRQYAFQPQEQYSIERTTHHYTTEQSKPIIRTEYSVVDFKFPVGPVFDYVRAVVNCPSNRKDVPRLINNGDGTITVQYQPSESGLHELEVFYNGQPITGSPFKFYVDSTIPSGQVTAYGPGLSYGRPDMHAHFTIVTKDAGAGGLSLAVEGPSKAEIQCIDNKNGTCDVSYLPLAPGDYHIGIKFMDKHIIGSPFTAKIFGEPKKRSQICVGTTSDVPLRISEIDINNLNAIVISPTGREESCTLKRLQNGYLGISFTPKEVGEHLVNVLRSGRHIPNSPFKIFVGENEIGNASRVKLYGDGLNDGMVNETCQFVVDTRNAGYGGLSLSIEGPSKVEIECHDNHDGTCLVTYKPTEPGTYIINVKYADSNVPGSPFAVNIGGYPSSSLTERILRHQDAAEVSQIGNVCELNLIIPGYNQRNTTASVISPSGSFEMCEIIALSDNQFSIRFMPKELGVHTVSVKSDNRHVTGSPFQFTVGPLIDGGPHKVHIMGSGVERGLANDANQFTIYTREAGAGSLSIAIEGPSKAEIDFQDNKDGSCGVTYRVNEPGDYVCSIKFNDEHVPGSPFMLQIDENPYSSYSKPVKNENIIFNDSRYISIAALQDQGFNIGSKANFVINYHGLTDGSISAYVISPSNKEQLASISKIDNNQYSVHFVPVENGIHNVHVLVNNSPIPGSPFRVVVGEVTVSGEGIHHGHTGRINEFFVDTSNAGNGALTVTIDGPSKVQLNCQENESGYNFTYVPNAPGDYTISIKYGGNNHIIGSPFFVAISGNNYQSNDSIRETKSLTQTVHMISGSTQKGPSKPYNVKCEGDGLKVAEIGKRNEFIVDAGLAGGDVLYVGVSGPVRPCEEVNIKHLGNNRFQVNYYVQEKGRHLLMVRWGNHDVPGSPFEIVVPN